MDELKKRKTTRLQGVNYSDCGMYFITICTEKKRCTLARIVGTGVLDGPQTILTKQGQIADKYIRQMKNFYDNISIEHYVIMPNHIHLLLWVKGNENGPSRTPVPTMVQNSVVSRFISTFKRFTNKEYGDNLWQYRSYDHIIRNQKDYEEHLRYIEENPFRWNSDELYTKE